MVFPEGHNMNKWSQATPTICHMRGAGQFLKFTPHWGGKVGERTTRGA